MNLGASACKPWCIPEKLRVQGLPPVFLVWRGIPGTVAPQPTRKAKITLSGASSGRDKVFWLVYHSPQEVCFPIRIRD